jgi:GAF domain-containing protein
LSGFPDFNHQGAPFPEFKLLTTIVTLEQRYDRWERLLRRCCEADLRASRESRHQIKKLRLYLDAQTEWYLAWRSLEELPADSERKERLLQAKQTLDESREELRRTLHFT